MFLENPRSLGNLLKMYQQNCGLTGVLKVAQILQCTKRWKSSRFSAYDILRDRTRHEYMDRKFRVRKFPRYGGLHTVTAIAGAGIGKEVMRGVKRVLKAARAPIIFENIDMEPSEDLAKCNSDFAEGIMAIRRNGVCLKGSIENAKCDPAEYSRNIALRRNLDLYVNIIEYKSYPGIQTKHRGIDMVIVRQNTEGEYMMLEHEPREGIVQNMKIITEYNSLRTARHAFSYAEMHDRKSLMLVLSDTLPLATSMFKKCVRKVAAEYPQIKYDEKSTATVVKRLATNPQEFDMLLTTNLSGSLMSNMMFGVIGSPALMSSQNLGDSIAVFETGHRGKGESMTGKGIANPTAMLNATVDMLRYLRLDYHACMIHAAIEKTINVHQIHTFDIGGKATTDDVIDSVICCLGWVEGCTLPDTEESDFE